MASGSSLEKIDVLYKYLLQRPPLESERENWARSLDAGNTFEGVFRKIVSSDEHLSRFGVRPTHKPGHFYSPIVDSETVRDYIEKYRRFNLTEADGIKLFADQMNDWWNENLEVIASFKFKDEPTPGLRYRFSESVYPYGDAIMLRAMLATNTPRRIIEIGSGWSTACMLDTIDEFDLATKVTCIEPNTERMFSLLKPGDRDRIELLIDQVQNIPLSKFEELDKGDILFVDSSHVLKTGSDVHYEFFHILPRLRDGVLIHFHDIQFPFEYPDKWIFDLKFSWNEIYVLRAFLMFNSRFTIKFWNSYFVRQYGNKITETVPVFMKNPGSSIWIESVR